MIGVYDLSSSNSVSELQILPFPLVPGEQPLEEVIAVLLDLDPNETPAMGTDKNAGGFSSRAGLLLLQCAFHTTSLLNGK